MNLVESATLVLHVLTALAVCGFVLLQHGKGTLVQPADFEPAAERHAHGR